MLHVAPWLLNICSILGDTGTASSHFLRFWSSSFAVFASLSLHPYYPLGGADTILHVLRFLRSFCRICTIRFLFVAVVVVAVVAAVAVVVMVMVVVTAGGRGASSGGAAVPARAPQ